MIHANRRFSVSVIETLDDLAEKLTEHTWTLCTCFEYGGLLLVNDSFSENGAQEYAVYKDGKQIESLTVSWMTPERFKETIEGLRTGEIPPCAFPAHPPLQIESASVHQRCALCR